MSYEQLVDPDGDWIVFTSMSAGRVVVMCSSADGEDQALAGAFASDELIAAIKAVEDGTRTKPVQHPVCTCCTLHPSGNA